MFKTIFNDIQARNPEIYLIGIWGKDGLELEKAVYLPPDADTDLLGAELAEVVGKLDNLEVSQRRFPYRICFRKIQDHGSFIEQRLFPAFFFRTEPDFREIELLPEFKKRQYPRFALNRLITSNFFRSVSHGNF